MRQISENFLKGDLQILDLKHFSKIEDGLCMMCKKAIQEFRDWEKQYAQQTDMMELLYSSIEGLILRRRAEDAVRLYWVVRQDFRRAWRIYLMKNLQNSFKAQSAA